MCGSEVREYRVYECFPTRMCLYVSGGGDSGGVPLLFSSSSLNIHSALFPPSFSLLRLSFRFCIVSFFIIGLVHHSSSHIPNGILDARPFLIFSVGIRVR